ncbi:MAG: deoxyribose-phosphate aldolase [Calditrichia bacterium]|nr:deoxyribose-phosphate aldolase [Calditrichia bacterium]
MADVKNLKIAIGSDHGGFTLKEKLKLFLSDQGYEYHDCGTHSPESVDYPKFALAVAKKVSSGEADFGIVVDGAGIGSAMTANKVNGVRAAACNDLSLANNAREHNNANVLTLGAGFIAINLAEQIVSTFLTKKCTEDRHLKRVDKIDELDRQKAPVYEKNEKDEIQKTINKEAALNNINTKDLEQISQRVREILSAQPAGESPSNNNEMVCKCGIHVDRTEETIRQFMDFGVERFGYNDASGCDCVPQDIAHCIDHTILKPDATDSEVIKLCEEAAQYEFASVCVSPSYVNLAAKQLSNSPVKVCTVVGFPSGAHNPEIKAMETRQAIREGAKEIDMVINIGALKSGNDELVYRDIRMVCEACEDGRAISKVIIETAFLTDDEKVRVCKLAKKAKANYVKTSTGFAKGGATVEDVSLMKSVVGDAGMKVKASAGIRTFEDAEKMIQAGADRIGASASIKIVQGSHEVTLSN